MRIERNVHSAHEGVGPPLFHVSEDVSEPEDLDAMFERMSETADAFLQRQERVHEQFQSYCQSLSEASGRFILETMSLDEVRSLLVASPTYLSEWLKLLNDLDGAALSKVHRMGTLVAQVAATAHPSEATELLRHLNESREVVHFTSGMGGASLERTAVCAVAISVPAVQLMCFGRIDRAQSDAEIAQDVLSAHLAGAEALVRDYVDQRLAVEEPAWIARALTVSGYSDECVHAEDTLSGYENEAGFIGRAAAAARYAYDRNRWSKEWFKHMAAANTHPDLWRYSVLLAKTIDARCELWWSCTPNEAELLRRFEPTFRQDFERRIKKWRDKRRKTLFGEKLPAPEFLQEIKAIM